VKLLSLLDTLHVLSPSLRFCISGFHNQKSSYHISARFASAEADFVAIFRFHLCFPPGYGMLSATFYWKEGAPEWSELLRGLLEIPRRRLSVSGSKCAHF
jgi:hypothetical protein